MCTTLLVIIAFQILAIFFLFKTDYKYEKNILSNERKVQNHLRYSLSKHYIALLSRQGRRSLLIAKNHAKRRGRGCSCLSAGKAATITVVIAGRRVRTVRLLT